MKSITTLVAVIAVTAFNLTMTPTASAVPCSAGYLTGAVSCQDGALNSNNDSLSEINAGTGFFGNDDWAFLQKQDTDPAQTDVAYDIGLVIDPVSNVSTGSWAIADNAWSLFDDIMIVLKVGRTSKLQPIYWSAYLLDGSSTSGLWDTGGQGLSHISVYGRGPHGSVPEPGTMGLLGLALLVLAVGAKSYRFTNTKPNERKIVASAGTTWE